MSDRFNTLNRRARRPKTLPRFALFSVSVEEFVLGAIEAAMIEPVFDILRPNA